MSRLLSKFIKQALTDRAVEKELPRTFYKGSNPGDERRISTGATEWDKHMFASSNRDDATMYGSNIQELIADPDTRILYQGTPDWKKTAGLQLKNENLLSYADRAALAAKAAGYDAAWFERQGDVGTAIFNPHKFRSK